MYRRQRPKPTLLRTIQASTRCLFLRFGSFGPLCESVRLVAALAMRLGSSGRADLAVCLRASRETKKAFSSRALLVCWRAAVDRQEAGERKRNIGVLENASAMLWYRSADVKRHDDSGRGVSLSLVCHGVV
jgi:hypothetical protein